MDGNHTAPPRLWMRRGRYAFGALAALALAFAACEGDLLISPVTIAIEPRNPSVAVGGTLQLSAAVGGTDDQRVAWESDDPGIAAVDENGLVTGVAEGETVITAVALADPAAVAATTVTVEPPPVTVTVTPDGQTIAVGETLQLTATVANAADQTVDWVSLTPGIAEVDATGLVTGIAAGTATIEATSRADPSAKDEATVVVVPTAPAILIAGITDAATGQPADPDAIAGEIVVAVEYEVGAGSDATTLEVLVDDAVQCTYPVSSGPQQVDCTIATDATDPGTGAPLFPDGAHTIRARLVNATGDVRAEAAQPVTFANAGG